MTVLTQWNKDALTQYIESLDQALVQKCIDPISFPLVLDSVEQEMSLIFWHCMLYAPKWNTLLADGDYLHKIRYGLFSLSISPSLERSNGNGLCSYKFLKSLAVADIADAFNINTHVTEQVQPGLEMTKPGPLMDLAKWILDMMQNYAELTGENGKCSDFLTSIARESDGDAAKFVCCLRKALGLADESQVGCMMLCQALHEKYAEKFPTLFDFGKSLNQLPAIVDEYFVRFLVKHAVLTEDATALQATCNEVYDYLIQATMDKNPAFYSKMNSVLWHRFFANNM